VTHALADTYPRPSGWRAICTCGEEVRGYDRAEALSRFLEHCEAEHLDLLARETGQ
jgi:hypothetical protein